MPRAKILVIPGSMRTGSHNAKLAALAAKEFALADADVTRISLVDYPLPLYDADVEAKSGVPRHATQLKQMIAAHHGVFIVTPEYNASLPPTLKNAVDWISRASERGEKPLSVFERRAFALGSASPLHFGGFRALMALRQVLEIGCGALVIPEQIAVPHAAEAFDDRDNLRDSELAAGLQALARRLIAVAEQVGQA